MGANITLLPFSGMFDYSICIDAGFPRRYTKPQGFLEVWILHRSTHCQCCNHHSRNHFALAQVDCFDCGFPDWEEVGQVQVERYCKQCFCEYCNICSAAKITDRTCCIPASSIVQCVYDHGTVRSSPSCIIFVTAIPNWFLPVWPRFWTLYTVALAFTFSLFSRHFLHFPLHSYSSFISCLPSYVWHHLESWQTKLRTLMT